MFNFLYNSIKRLKNKEKEGILIFVLSFGVCVACQGVLEEGNPFGPSKNPTDGVLKVVPNTATVTTGGNLTLTTVNGTEPISWTSSALNVGTIIVNTGIFTATAIPGSVTITAIDAEGNTATAAITTIAGVSLTFDVAGATQLAISTDDVINVTANGSGVGLTTTVVNKDTVSTYALLPTIVTTANAITITSPAVLPTAAQGDQTFTITVTDVSNTNTGTLTYLLQAGLV